MFNSTLGVPSSAVAAGNEKQNNYRTGIDHRITPASYLPVELNLGSSLSLLSGLITVEFQVLHKHMLLIQN